MQNSDNQKPVVAEEKTQEPQKRPNETGTISVTGFVKIFDPNSKQTFVETRT